MKRLVFVAILLLIIPIASGQESATLSSTSINPSAGFVYIVPNLSEITIPSETYYYQNITIAQTGNYPVTIHTNKTGTVSIWTNFTDGVSYYDHMNVTLSVAKSNDTRIRIYVPYGNEGQWNLTLEGYSLNDSKSNTTNITVIVNDTSPIDDVTVSVLSPLIYQGNNLELNVSILKVSPPYPIDFTIGYCITLASANAQCTMATALETETRAIETYLTFLKTISNVNEVPGNYLVKVVIEYKFNEDIPDRAKASDTFSIVTTGGGSGGGDTGSGGGGSPITPITRTYELEILDLPDEYEISPLIKETLIVRVKNKKAQVTNMTLKIRGIQEEWFTISPRIVSKLDEGDVSTFLVTLEVPQYLSQNNYTLTFIADANQVDAVAEMKLIILGELKPPITEKNKCLQEISNLKTIADILFSEIVQLGLEGKVTTEALATITNARSILDTVESRVLSDQTEQCSVEIEKAREKMEKVTNIINELKQEEAKENFYIPLVLVTAVLLAALVIVGFSWGKLKLRLKHHKKRRSDLKRIKKHIKKHNYVHH
ncbi:MAG: hypothetical protein ABIJ92_02720 [Candidatus Aenigmatarchaeota archaeon]